VKAAVVLGTRPEIIKLAPVIKEMERGASTSSPSHQQRYSCSMNRVFERSEQATSSSGALQFATAANPRREAGGGSAVYDVLAVVVNYNSRPFIAIERKLLEGLAELGRAVRLKLLLVDNCSADGSFEELREHARRLGLDAEAVRLSRNFGFTRAVNIAWRYARRRWEFRYFMLLNNDLVIVPGNVLRLLRYLEVDGVAGVQGTVMQAANPRLVDNCGFFVDRFGLTHPICRGFTVECAKLCYPSFLSGAFSVYRADAISELGTPFDDRVECYYDDKHLGLRLWSSGRKLLHVPLVVAYHLGSASYAARRKLKSPQWFKGVVVAELAPSRALGTASHILPVLYYGVVSVALTLLTRANYVKSYVSSLREVNILSQDRALRFGLLPKIGPRIFLNRLERGVRLS